MKQINATTQMHLTNMSLSERSQTQKGHAARSNVCKLQEKSKLIFGAGSY